MDVNQNDNDTGTSCEGVKSGRCSVEVQHRPGRQYATDPKSYETSKSRKGQRGRNKVKWSKEELKVVWECYLRSKIIAPDGYIEVVMDLWNGRDVNVRS